MSAPRKKPVQARPVTTRAFGPRTRQRAQEVIPDTTRIDLGPEPEVANTVTERQLEERKPKYPCPGFTAQNWIEAPRNVIATERTKSGMAFGVRNAAGDARWDADAGAGATRRIPRGTPQPPSYTAR